MIGRLASPLPARLASVALAVAALTASCKAISPTEVPLSELVIADGPRILTGPVDFGKNEREATYVLADVENRGDKDAVVTLAGALVVADGSELGPLRIETLRLPAGQTRLFALVANEVEPVASLKSARLEVTSAVRSRQDAAVIATGVTQHQDEGRAVVEGMIENQTDHAVTVVVLGSFYDATGKPVMRRTTIYKLDRGGKRSAQFVGPRESTRGDLFIGDVGRGGP